MGEQDWLADATLTWWATEQWLDAAQEHMARALIRQQELVERQEQLRQMTAHAFERYRQLMSWLFECQALAHEQEWRQTHLQD